MVASKTAVESGVVRAKNARQKRKLLNEAPKVFENAKSTIFIKGGNVSDIITNVFTDLHRLKVSCCCIAGRHLLLFSRLTAWSSRKRTSCGHLKMLALLNFSQKRQTLLWSVLEVTTKRDRTTLSLPEHLIIRSSTWSSLESEITLR